MQASIEVLDKSTSSLPPNRIRVSGPGPTFMGVSVSGRVAYFLVMNDGSHHELAAVLRIAVEFWRMELADKNLPSPFI